MIETLVITLCVTNVLLVIAYFIDAYQIGKLIRRIMKDISSLETALRLHEIQGDEIRKEVLDD